MRLSVLINTEYWLFNLAPSESTELESTDFFYPYFH